MHTLISKRPYFSVCVPCYNSRKYLGGLLASIVNQNMFYGDIEVVLADDCSTEPYNDIVEPFKKQILIKQVKTKYNCCPGNTRQCAVDAATGQWVIFADHDDEFMPNVFKEVQRGIEKTQCDSIFTTHFVKEYLNGQIQDLTNQGGWTHGKFFNLDNFWKKYGLHYKKDLTSHEDIYLTSQTTYIELTRQNEIHAFDYELVTYKWYERSDSVTSQFYKTSDGAERGFIDYYFVDYLTSTAGSFYGFYLQKNEKSQKIDEIVTRVIQNDILYGYYYLQYSLTITPEYLKKNYEEVKKYLDILKDQFNITPDDIVKHFRFDYQQDYVDVYQSSTNLTGIMLPLHGFKEWLDIISSGNF